LLLGAPGFAVGWQQPVYIPAPAAGTGWVHQVSGQFFERLLVATWQLTTSGAGPARYPGLQLLDSNGTIVAEVTALNTYAPGATRLLSLWVGAPVMNDLTDVDITAAIPDLLVPPGWTWKSSALSYDVADQEGPAVLLVQQYPNDSVSYPVIS
jgi:hypothetical protein